MMKHTRQTDGLTRSPAAVWAKLLVLLLLSTGITANALAAVSAEAWVSEARPYAHQSIIYTLRVYHGAIKELTPEPLNVPGLSLERLDGPPETTRTIDSQHLYSDFHYALTAINAGAVPIPPMHVKVTPGRSTDRYGRITGGRNSQFMVEGSAVNLEVLAAPANAVQPWLPLYELQLTVKASGTRNARVGEPITLVVNQQAWGGSGDQIPKFERYLQHPDLKIYPEQSELLTEIHDSGRYLIGVRQETFTLIPTQEGKLHIPPVEVQWWDLNANRSATARWNGLDINVGYGTGGTDNGSGGTGTTQGMSLLVMVLLFLLVALASFFLGWWLSSGRPGLAALLARGAVAAATTEPGEQGPSPEQPAGRLAQWRAGLPARRQALLNRLLLVKQRRRWAVRLRALEPRWMALWRLRAEMAASNDPKQLESLMQRYAAIQMRLKEYASLSEIAAAIKQHYPKITGTTAGQLLHRLDANLYGGEADDPAMTRCSKDLCCVLRSMGLRCPPGGKTRPRSKLPDLNPGHHNP